MRLSRSSAYVKVDKHARTVKVINLDILNIILIIKDMI
jgi:hypothetical protein